MRAGVEGEEEQTGDGADGGGIALEGIKQETGPKQLKDKRCMCECRAQPTIHHACMHAGRDGKMSG